MKVATAVEHMTRVCLARVIDGFAPSPARDLPDSSSRMWKPYSTERSRAMRAAVAAVFLLALAMPGVSSAQDSAVTWDDIPWAKGPLAGSLGKEAQVAVPAGCVFAGKDGTRMFMELTQNPADGSEVGVVVCPPVADSTADPWFVVFSFDPSGYVKDEQRDDLDADAILASIRRGTEAANERRRKRGWGTLTVDGWVTRPHYDVDSHNLTWALSAVDETGSHTVNHSVRLLGRKGVMHADLVTSPEHLAALLPVFDTMISGFEYLPGNRYAEWRKGDKVASYGLTALVAGGAGAVAVKTGLLAKLWKLLVAGVVAIGAALKRFWKRLTGGRQARQAQ